jgi:glycosyl transferase family 87
LLRSRTPSRTRVGSGVVIIVATALALGIRLFTVTRPGFLTQSTEYDDGVYLGAAIRLTQGILPYRDFAYLQPPGLMLLMAPVGWLARSTTTVTGMMVARLLTVAASTACIPLVGQLVRYRGALVTALSCGILAIYPPDINTAHTLMLEPWLNLLCLLGANAAFRSGRLAPRPRQLALAGAMIGLAGTVKYWAAAPAAVLLVVCLADRELRWRRTGAYAGGVCAGFLIPVAWFIHVAPGAFFSDTIVYQAVRVGARPPTVLRLAHITGLIDILNYYGQVTLTAGGNSLFANSTTADSASGQLHVWPYLAALLFAALIAAGFLLRRTQLEWFAFATASLALAAILSYSAFFYHYPAFPAPWLAIIAGVTAGQFAGMLPRWFRAGAVAVIALVMAAVCALQLTEVAQIKLPTGGEAISSAIPAGACVFADQVALIIAANRFTATEPGCPVVIDSLATTLALTNGVSIQAGANSDLQAVTAWEKIMIRAQYLWFSPSYERRIPRPDVFWSWVWKYYTRIVPIDGTIPGFGQLFERRT